MKGTISRRGFIRSTLGGAAGASFLARPAVGAGRFEPPSLRDRMSLWDLPTPALLIDLGAMEANLNKMADYYRPKRARLRPHAKTHKCPVIARKQMELGAVGVCAAKVSEAEVLVEGGVGKVLITSPVVSADKIERVVKLAARSPDVQMVVDQPANVKDFNDAAAAAGVKLTVLIDLNLGSDRTGLDPGEPTVKLAQEVGKRPSLRFGGLQAYAGHLMHVVGFEYRKALSRKALARALESKHRLEKAGFEVPVLSVGGTGTYNVDGDVDGVTDVQVGSYLFMDVNYRAVGGERGPIFDDFQPSLLVLATAISQPVPGRITIDAGYKAFATDQEPPELRDIQGVSYRWGGDEHGILQFRDPSRQIQIGDKVLLLASHCDPTVNLYDQFYTFRGEEVEGIWPIAARGRSQ